MKIDQLLYFIETAEQEHLGKASQRLHVTPSTISHSLRALEDELGSQLFDRVGRSLSLTPAGQAFLTRARIVAGEFQALKTDFLSPELEWEGQLRIALTIGLGRVLIPAWSKLLKKHRKATLEISNRRSVEVMELTAAGRVDAGLCYNPVAHPDLESTVVRKEPLQLAIRKNHPLAKLSESRRIPRLNQTDRALPVPAYGVDLSGIFPDFKRHGISTSATFVIDNYEDAARYVSATDAWSLIPESYLRPFGLKSISPRDWRTQLSLCAVQLKNRKLPRVFMALLKEMSDG